MTKKREPTKSGANTTTAAAAKRASKTVTTTSRGTAAGLRAGAGTATKAKAQTSGTGKLSQKELTKRGGPGRAGSSASQNRKGVAKKKSATRGRGLSAKAGA